MHLRPAIMALRGLAQREAIQLLPPLLLLLLLLLLRCLGPR